MFTIGPLRWRSPVARHRNGPSRVGSIVGGLALLVAVVLVGGVVANSQLTTDEREREFVATGVAGEPVATDGFVITVLGVRAAADVAAGQFRHDTGGLWLLVRVRAEAIDEPVLLTYAAVQDSQGRTWLASDRIEQPLVGFGGHQLQPGIPVEAEVVFEVPRAAATDLSVRLGTGSGLYGRVWAATVEVPLAVDQPTITHGLSQTHVQPAGPDYLAGGTGAGSTD